MNLTNLPNRSEMLGSLKLLVRPSVYLHRSLCRHSNLLVSQGDLPRLRRQHKLRVYLQVPPLLRMVMVVHRFCHLQRVVSLSRTGFHLHSHDLLRVFLPRMGWYLVSFLPLRMALTSMVASSVSYSLETLPLLDLALVPVPKVRVISPHQTVRKRRILEYYSKRSMSGVTQGLSDYQAFLIYMCEFEDLAEVGRDWRN